MRRVAHRIKRIDNMTSQLATLRLAELRGIDNHFEIDVLLAQLNRQNNKIPRRTQGNRLQWLRGNEPYLTYLYVLGVLAVTIGLIVFWCLMVTYLYSSLAGSSLGH